MTFTFWLSPLQPSTSADRWASSLEAAWPHLAATKLRRDPSWLSASPRPGPAATQTSVMEPHRSSSLSLLPWAPPWWPFGALEAFKTADADDCVFTLPYESLTQFCMLILTYLLLLWVLDKILTVTIYHEVHVISLNLYIPKRKLCMWSTNKSCVSNLMT